MEGEGDKMKSEFSHPHVLGSASIGVFQTSPKGRLLYADVALAEIFGYDSSEDFIRNVKNTGRQLYIDPRDRDAVIAAALPSGSLLGRRVALRDANGEAFIANIVVARIVRGADGSIDRLEGTIEDVSGRKSMGNGVQKSPKALRAKPSVPATAAGAPPEPLPGARERELLAAALAESEGMCSSILNAFDGCVLVCSEDFRIERMNERLAELVGHDATGEKCHEALYGRESVCPECGHAGLSMKKVARWEMKDPRSGRWRYVMANAFPRANASFSLVSLILDVTRCKEMEIELESKTTQLAARLCEIEEMNSALKVLLNRGEQIKAHIEESVMCNVKEIITPCIEKLQKSRLDSKQRTWLDVIEASVNDIVSPFIKKVLSRYSSLTPTEIQIATLIQEGWTGQQIADAMGVSVNTIRFHKANLRKKFGLRHKKTNLQSYLHSINKE